VSRAYEERETVTGAQACFHRSLGSTFDLLSKPLNRELFISCDKLKNLDTFSKSDPFVIVELSPR
jgi:hypothetical protein